MSDDPFRATLAATARGESAEAAMQRQQRRADRIASAQAALDHPAGRAFLTRRLEEERAAAPWQPGDTLEAVAHRAGRVALLRELLAEIAETPPATPGA